MVLVMKPQLKIVDKQKLHISRHPGIAVWLLLGLSVVIFVEVSRRLTDNIFILIVSTLGELMFGLDLSGEWEDLVLDKEKNKATITRCSWCDKLCSRTPEQYTTVMKLSDIRHVGVSLNLGLFLLHRSGKTASISTQDLTREEIQNLRREVNYFLNTSRIEYLDKYTTDPYDRLLTPSDSEDEFLQGLSTIRQPISILKDSPMINRAQDDAERSEERHQIEPQRSPSSLGNQRQSETSRRVSQRRGPYTDNSARDIYPRCTRHNCMAS